MSARIKAALKQAVSLAICAALAIAGHAVANDIYKWTDAEGNVHYEDRPTEDGTAERVDIKSRPTDRSRIAAMQDARRTARQEEAKAEAASNEPTPEQLRAEREERAKQCSAYKERLQTMVQSRRLYREDENGERVYLDEAEMEAAREDAAAKIDEFCNS